MKKYFLVTAIALVSLLTFVGCSDDDETPVVSIEKSEYTMSPSGSVTVRLTIQNHNGSEVKVPFNLSGTAVKDEHYTVSADEFVFSGGSNSAELVFQAKDNYDESRTIELQLGTLPAGFSMGNVAKTTITVQPKDDIVFTFQRRKETLFSEIDILVKVGTSSSSYIAEKDMTIPIVVETEGTTAVEGEHFEFVGEKAVTIAKGKSEGTISLKWLKTEEGKNSIKLGAGPDLLPGMVLGQNINVTITIVGPVAGTIQGKWAAKALVNYDWFELNNGGTDDYEQYPLPTDVSEIDVIEITTDEEGTPVLKTSLQGVLKNYFRDCVLTYKNEEEERLQENGWPFQKVNILLVELEKANVSFSATNENVREAEIGFRTFESEGQTILEVTLRDFEPTDFLQNTFDMAKTWGDNPIMKTYPLRYHFVKKVD